MQEQEAMEFYERLTQGTERYNEITLEESSGAALSGFRINTVDKRKLASIIERLPEEIFDGEEVDEELDEDDLEELNEEDVSSDNMAAMTENTVDAFEDLVQTSLSHPKLTSAQIDTVVEELDFEVLFELGSQIINMSVESTGKIQAFHEQE